MSEEKKIQENQENKKEEAQTEFSEIKNTEDFSSPEGPTTDISEIRCPLCPKFAKITINHIKNEIISECPDNHYMKLDFLSFIEKSTDHPIVCTKCSICNSTGKTNSYCLECNKYFCVECMEKHNKNELPFNNGGVFSNILLRNNTLEGNGSSNLNTSFPNHLTTLNLVNNNNSIINPVEHHVINVNEQDTQCAIHQKEKFIGFCLKCNKSFCQKCLEEIAKREKTNLNALSCGKFGNIQHSIKKIKDIVGEKKLKKIKQSLDKEVDIINYIENQSNIIIEQLLEKINNLREIHTLKQQLYELYLKNQGNASLVKTIIELEKGFTLHPSQFNTNEKLLKNLEIINVNLPVDKKEKQKKIEIKNFPVNENNNEKKEEEEEDKKEEVIISKLERKKLKEENKKKIQKLRAEKLELRKNKEELRKKKLQKKAEKQKKKENKKEVKDENNNQNGEKEEIPLSQNNIDNNNKDLNNGNSNP